MRMSIRRHFLHLTGLVLSLLFGGLALAEDKADDKYAWSKSKVIDGRFMLGVGGVVTRFDTNYKITDKSSGVSIFIDGEGTLGLPTTNVSPGFYGLWRITEKHGIGFNYFSSDRDGETLGVDRNFGDLNVTGAVKIFDRSKNGLVSLSIAVHVRVEYHKTGSLGRTKRLIIIYVCVWI